MKLVGCMPVITAIVRGESLCFVRGEAKDVKCKFPGICTYCCQTHFCCLDRNCGIANGLHKLQVQIAMRGTGMPFSTSMWTSLLRRRAA